MGRLPFRWRCVVDSVVDSPRALPVLSYSAIVQMRDRTERVSLHAHGDQLTSSLVDSRAFVADSSPFRRGTASPRWAQVHGEPDELTHRARLNRRPTGFGYVVDSGRFPEPMGQDPRAGCTEGNAAHLCGFSGQYASRLSSTRTATRPDRAVAHSPRVSRANTLAQARDTSRVSRAGRDGRQFAAVTRPHGGALTRSRGRPRDRVRSRHHE